MFYYHYSDLSGIIDYKNAPILASVYAKSRNHVELNTTLFYDFAVYRLFQPFTPNVPPIAGARSSHSNSQTIASFRSDFNSPFFGNQSNLGAEFVRGYYVFLFETYYGMHVLSSAVFKPFEFVPVFRSAPSQIKSLNFFRRNQFRGVEYYRNRFKRSYKFEKPIKWSDLFFHSRVIRKKLNFRKDFFRVRKFNPYIKSTRVSRNINHFYQRAIKESGFFGRSAILHEVKAIKFYNFFRLQESAYMSIFFRFFFLNLKILQYLVGLPYAQNFINDEGNLKFNSNINRAFSVYFAKLCYICIRFFRVVYRSQISVQNLVGKLQLNKFVFFPKFQKVLNWRFKNFLFNVLFDFFSSIGQRGIIPAFELVNSKIFKYTDLLQCDHIVRRNFINIVYLFPKLKWHFKLFDEFSDLNFVFSEFTSSCLFVGKVDHKQIPFRNYGLNFFIFDNSFGQYLGFTYNAYVKFDFLNEHWFTLLRYCFWFDQLEDWFDVLFCLRLTSSLFDYYFVGNGFHYFHWTFYEQRNKFFRSNKFVRPIDLENFGLMSSEYERVRVNMLEDGKSF